MTEFPNQVLLFSIRSTVPPEKDGMGVPILLATSIPG
jgi:hypothetical protein